MVERLTVLVERIVVLFVTFVYLRTVSMQKSQISPVCQGAKQGKDQGWGKLSIRGDRGTDCIMLFLHIILAYRC